MSLDLTMPDDSELRPKITVFGVGGAGGNAVNNMIEKNLEGAEFVVANTDAQALAGSRAHRRIQLGGAVTRGLGAGMRPEVGRGAAEESIDEVIDHLAGSNMCFITAGMGGGTGTGAAPVIARAAREMGILTIGVVTKPFQFEGGRRMALAVEGCEELQQYVDTLIVIPNQNLFRIASEKTTVLDAFIMADDVLYQGVKGVTDLMVMPGLVNLDFADVRTVMNEMGKAMMGTGDAEGESRAVDAAEKAIANPLLDDVSLQGARGVLINITGGYDLTLFEVDEAANRIRAEVDQNANIIVGSCFDTELEGRMRVSVVATGIDAADAIPQTPPQDQRREPSYEPAPRPSYRYAEPQQQQQQQQQPQSQGQPRTPGNVNHSARNAIRRAATDHRPDPYGGARPTERYTHPYGEPIMPQQRRPDPAHAPAQPQPRYTREDPPRGGGGHAAREDAFIPPRADRPTGSRAPRNVVIDPAADDVAYPSSPQPQEATTAPQRGDQFDAARAVARSVADRGERAETPQSGPKKQDSGQASLEIPTFLRRQAN